MKMVLPVDGYRSAADFMAAIQGSKGDTYWLMKPAQHWHGGIHLYGSFASNAIYKPDCHGLKCMTDGQVVAWRLNDDYQTAAFGEKTLKFSSTFVLIKSTCTPDKDKTDNSLDFYTLWMQIAPLSEYNMSDNPIAVVTASALKVRQDHTFSGWKRCGLAEGEKVSPEDLHYFEVPLDTYTTLPRGAVVEIEQEASFLLNGSRAPFMFVKVVSVPEGKKSGISAGETGWISGLDKFVKRQGNVLPMWMQEARKQGVFNKVVTAPTGNSAINVRAGEVIGHLSLYEHPYVGSQHFCHLEVFSQDVRMEDFLANKSGVMSGRAELHTLVGKTRWLHREQENAFVQAGTDGHPSLSSAERFTAESDCSCQEADGKTWYYIPGEQAWMAATDVEKVNQFELGRRGFIALIQEDAPKSIFQTPKENWLRQVFSRLEELTQNNAEDSYSSNNTQGYQKLIQQMDTNGDGIIGANELWLYLHNSEPSIQYQVQRLVIKHHSEWLKDGISALWQAALDEQAKKYPELALYNRDFINKLVWMKDVAEIRSDEALWHMHPVVFLDAVSAKISNTKIVGKDFVEFVFREAQKNERKSRVPAAITTAQAILETGYGKAVPVDIYSGEYSNNLFGIKAHGDPNFVWVNTHEFVDGVKKSIVDKFMKYNSYEESISGRSDFFAKNKRYHFLFDYTDPCDWARGLQSAGYATDPNYANKLISIMRREELL